METDMSICPQDLSALVQVAGFLCFWSEKAVDCIILTTLRRIQEFLAKDSSSKIVWSEHAHLLLVQSRAYAYYEQTILPASSARNGFQSAIKGIAYMALRKDDALDA